MTDNGERILLATSATGPHPFPSRTRSLSLSAPMVLRLRGRGRVGRRQLHYKCPMSNIQWRISSWVTGHWTFSIPPASVTDTDGVAVGHVVTGRKISDGD